MGVRSAGYGLKGAAGAKGDAGGQGPVGATGASGAQGVKGDTGLAGSKGDTGSQGAIGATGPQGATGSAATATPLATVAPLPDAATAAVGVSAKAAKEDHVHPMLPGRLTLIGTATVGETLLVSLSLGVKRYTGTMAGLAVGDRIMAFLTGSPGSSSLQDIYVSAANTYNVGVLNPALGIGATVAVPVAVYKLV